MPMTLFSLCSAEANSLWHFSLPTSFSLWRGYLPFHLSTFKIFFPAKDTCGNWFPELLSFPTCVWTRTPPSSPCFLRTPASTPSHPPHNLPCTMVTFQIRRWIPATDCLISSPDETLADHSMPSYLLGLVSTCLCCHQECWRCLLHNFIRNLPARLFPSCVYPHLSCDQVVHSLPLSI